MRVGGNVMSGSRPDRLLCRDDLEEAFQALEQKLAEQGVRAHVYFVGGAAMAMAYRRSRRTMDVDALTIDQRETVLEASAEVGRELGLGDGWLNDDVRTQARVEVAPDARARVLYDSPHLVVTGASETHLLAMKVHAARGADEEDIKWLLKRLRVRTMVAVEDIHRAVFPDGEIPRRGSERIGRLLREMRDEDRRDWARGHRVDYGLER